MKSHKYKTNGQKERTRRDMAAGAESFYYNQRRLMHIGSTQLVNCFPLCAAVLPPQAETW